MCKTVFCRWRLEWLPDVDNIGGHRLRQEPRHGRGDNTARVTFLVEHWATEIRGDPWNMTEATSSIPVQFTIDVSQVLQSKRACPSSPVYHWTDSNSGSILTGNQRWFQKSFLYSDPFTIETAWSME
jgi:hypothetical protein